MLSNPVRITTVISFVFGTSAELIKLRPIIDDLESQGQEFEVLCTGQQYSELLQLPYFNLLLARENGFYWVAKGFRKSSLTKSWQVVFWLLSCCRWIIRNFFSARRRNRGLSVFVVHGDTMTTVVGSLMGRLLGATVAHVEAGLRSHDWRNPFPEELNRILTSKIAGIHFAPDQTAVANLSSVKGEVFCTEGNTISDQVFRELGLMGAHPTGGAVVVLLHRTELLNNSRKIDETLSALIEISKSCSRMTIVLDALARAALSSLTTFSVLSNQTSVVISGKLDHRSFLLELIKSDYVITDSGGVQEESAALGIPCIIHRVASERLDGLGHNGTAVLTGLDPAALLAASSSPPMRKDLEVRRDSPTEIILKILTKYQFLTKIV